MINTCHHSLATRPVMEYCDAASELLIAITIISGQHIPVSATCESSEILLTLVELAGCRQVRQHYYFS